EDAFPVWTPDERIIFCSIRGGGGNIFRQRADGSGVAQQLTTGAKEAYPNSLSPDGTLLIFQETHANTGADLMLLTVAPGGRIKPFLATAFRETTGEISPDGRWVAYASNESNQTEIYVRPFPIAGESRYPVSNGGGVKPTWARNGKELFYLDGTSMMSVAIQTEPSFRAGTP